MSTDVKLDGDRYVISVDGTPAGLAQFAETGDQRIFFHTEVNDAFAGQGLAGVLVTHALDDTRASGKRAVAVCPYVKKFVAKHEEYADLVDAATPEAMAAVRAAQG